MKKFVIIVLAYSVVLVAQDDINRSPRISITQANAKQNGVRPNQSAPFGSEKSLARSSHVVEYVIRIWKDDNHDERAWRNSAADATDVIESMSNKSPRWLHYLQEDIAAIIDEVFNSKDSSGIHAQVTVRLLGNQRSSAKAGECPYDCSAAASCLKMGTILSK